MLLVPMIMVYFSAIINGAHSFPDSNIYFNQPTATKAPDDESWKLLIDAIYKGQEFKADLLLKNGANINQLSKNKGVLTTPLHIAVSVGQKNIVDLLLRHSANASAGNELGETPLHMAVSLGNEDITKALIQVGANVHAVDREGNTVLHVASRKGSIIDLLIDNEIKLDVVNNKHETPLYLAVRNNKTNAVFALVRNHADVNIADEDGVTPLHRSVYYNVDEKIVDLLLQNGANVKIADKNGNTALHWAGAFGNSKDISLPFEMKTIYNSAGKLIDWLINSGADVNAVNSTGDTPLHVAVDQNDLDYIRLLLVYHADPGIENKNGKSPIELCHDKLYYEGIDYLSRDAHDTDEACDKYSKQVSDRIVGGDLAELGEFPWMAALGYLDDSYKISFDCGGSIISEYFILTAAHCVKDARQPVVVRLGKVTLSDEDGVKPSNFKIKDIIRHPYYSITTKKNDIALIRTLKRIEFSDYMRPACLQTDLHFEDPNVKLFVTGWGIVSTAHHNRSNELRKTDLQTMPLSQCNTTFLNFNRNVNQKVFRQGISQSQYCAYDPAGKKDSCQGDSGGPLQIFPHGAGLAKIVGIVSFGIGCGTEIPSIYTRVAFYIPWIESHVWPYEDQIRPIALQGDKWFK